MLDSLLAVVGILVSLVLFFIGYRQTVGARKERISDCNAEIEKILVRRIVLESCSVARIDVERLIAGKARDFRVRPDDLMPAAQTLNSVYTRIMESNFLPADQRQQILDRVEPALTEAEAKPAEESEINARRTRRNFFATTTALSIMAVLASLAGALVAALPGLANLDKTYPELFKSFLVTALASLAVIGCWVAVHRIRASQEDSSTRGNDAGQSVRFEGEVAATLRRLGFVVRPTPRGHPGFVAEQAGRKIIVEAKSWPHRVPARAPRELAERLRQAADELGADEVLVVTQVPLVDAGDALRVAGVQTVSIEELGSRLAQRKDIDRAG